MINDQHDTANCPGGADCPYRCPAKLIIVTYRSCDGSRKRCKFRTLSAAQRFAHHYVGAHPEIAGWYAVSGDGVGHITVEGCALAELFPLSPSYEWAVFSFMQALRSGGEALAWYAQRSDGATWGAYNTRDEAEEEVRRQRFGY